jgi:adenylate kinase family enzyme
MGRSGCGKGTQAELLKNYLENKKKEEGNEEEKVMHLTTGGNFRELIKRDIYTTNEIKETLNAGGLMPEFLAIWNWSNIFINNLTENETIILDGAPRKLIEVDALDSAINFYDYKKVTIIYLNVSKDWAVNRLASRGREDDDQKEEQERKMSWFESDVLPCIDLYKNKSEDIVNFPNQNNIDYNFLEINGEQSVEEVSAELISKLK